MRVTQYRKVLGFTLIELMITVAIIAILAAIAYPSYTDYVTRARRADGKAGILAMQLALEKHRANNVSYASFTGCPTDTPSPDGKYKLNCSNLAATTYTVTATPNITDSKCGNLSITQAGIKSASLGTAADCWDK